jgi:outer membrane murein-binding lipoprotein Lpp
MRLTTSITLCIVASTLLLSGCSSSTQQPQAPEEGSVQAYLDAHPEALEDEEVASEEEEFAASEEE